MNYLPLLIPALFVLYVAYKIHQDGRCECCGKKYTRGFNKKGHAVYINKHLSRDYVADVSLGGGNGWNDECYCTECYIEKFDEEPNTNL